MSLRTRLTGAILLAALLAATVVLWWAKAQEAQPLSVKLAKTEDVATALMMVALEKGFFAREGLNVEVKSYPSGKRSLEGLFAGEVDVALPADTPIVFQSFAGRDFRVVATIATSGSYHRIVARRDHGIGNAMDLRGKHIATQRASAVHYFLHLFLLKHGLTVNDIRLSFMQPEELPQALASGEIDAFSMREPFVSEARRRLGDKVIVFGDTGVYLRSDNVVMRDDFVRDRPETLQRVLRALLRAEDFVRDRPDDAIRLVAKELRVMEREVRDVWMDFRFTVSLPQTLLSSLEDEAQWAVDAGLVRPQTIPNYLDFIHLGSLDAVRPARVTIIR